LEIVGRESLTSKLRLSRYKTIIWESLPFYPLLALKAGVDSAKTVRPVLDRILQFLPIDIVINLFFCQITPLAMMEQPLFCKKNYTSTDMIEDATNVKNEYLW
jgi:hypothetical protein